MTRLFVKPVNAASMALSYAAASITRRPVITGMPVTVSFELTNHCNLRCPECSSGSGTMKRQRGFMERDLFEKAIRELKPYLWYSSLYFQGEPFLHPDLFSFIRMMGNTRTIISTNGHYLGGDNAAAAVHSGIYKLIVSLDGMDQESYSRYRVNGNMAEVMEGIRRISREKEKVDSPMKLELQFLVNKYNEHQIPLAGAFAGEVKATLKLKSMQVIDGHDAGEWMPSERKYSRYEKSGGKLSIKNKLTSRCLRLWLNPVITWDGKVLPCCFDKDAEYVMGDLSSESFRDIWHGARFKEFRLKVLSERRSIPICRNCSSGMRNVEL